MMQYEWILFDADETLFHFDAYEGLRRMFASFNVDFSPDDFTHYQSINKPLWVLYQDGKITARELQETRFNGWAKTLSVSAQQLNDAFLQSMADICKLLPGAQDLLDALQGKVKLGIITNGFTALQTIRLERTGLINRFELLVISEEVGVAKPDSAIFEHAFERMQHPEKHRILMVGDNPHSDILGGINAGIHTCWYNAINAEKPRDITPHTEVSSLQALQAWLLPA
jgi:5'-nucleotidase